MSDKLKGLSFNGFIEKHPYLACVLLCSASLFVAQTHEIDNGVRNIVVGEYGLIWQIPVFALLSVLVCAFSAFVKEKE